jgi:hypothetical protein
MDVRKAIKERKLGMAMKMRKRGHSRKTKASNLLKPLAKIVGYVVGIFWI